MNAAADGDAGASARYHSTAMSRILRSLLLSLLLLSSARAVADDVTTDAWTPPPDQTGFTTFPGTRTPGALGLDGMLWFDYGHDTVRIAGRSLIEHRLAGALGAQLGLWGRGAIALRVPAVFQQSGASPRLSAQALGNPALDARVRVLGAASRPDGRARDGAALAVRGVVTLPIGTSRAYFADDSVRTELSLITDVEAFGLGAGASIGYRHRFADGTGSAAVPVSQPPGSSRQLRLAGGVKIPFPLISMAAPGKVQESAIVELDLGTDPEDFFRKVTSPLEARVSYRISAADLTFSLGAAVGITDAYGQPDVRVLFGVSYSPRQHDQDADGVPDGDDQCEHLAEDGDGFEDSDGCPEPDNDQDMVLDEDDRCPIAPAEVGGDEDEDGCTDR